MPCFSLMVTLNGDRIIERVARAKMSRTLKESLLSDFFWWGGGGSGEGGDGGSILTTSVYKLFITLLRDAQGYVWPDSSSGRASASRS
jgi:hypothetical protein